MNQPFNPWVEDTLSGPARPALSEQMPTLPPATGVTKPLPGLTVPDTTNRIPWVDVTGTATLWVTGVHGGAGESRLAGLFSTARTSGHAWPVPDNQEHPPRVLLVCRSDLRGLTAARNALIEWASGATPDIELLGLAVLADAPGKLPRPLRDFASIVAGGAPRHWMLPWVEAWRLASDDVPPGPGYQRFLTDITALTT